MSSRQKRIWIVLACIAGLIAYAPVKKLIRTHLSAEELANRTETFSGDSGNLKSTAILPTLDSPIQSGKNNIWCSSFQMAWNEMKDNVIREPVLVADAQDVCMRLNSAKQGKADLLPESYYAAAGKVSDGIIEKIQKDMSVRFPSKDIPQFNPNDELIAYAYLQIYMKFTKPFFQNGGPLTFTASSGKQTPIKSFWIGDASSSQREELCQQIEVLYCKTENNITTEFALDLCKQTDPYQLVVAITSIGETLESTYNRLQAEIKTFKNHENYDELAYFHFEDILYVPDIFWKIEHSFSELIGKSVMNISASGMPIAAANQMIYFRLDRSGVTLKSEAMLQNACAPHRPRPRHFVFDKPFLLYLKKRDAEQPFFVMWVDNAELLTPF